MIKVEEFKIPQDVYDEQFDIHIRPYLTTEDIIEIAKKMLLCDSELMQRYSLIVDVLRACTDIDDEYLYWGTEEDEEDKFLGWDLIIQSGLWGVVEKWVYNDIQHIWDYVLDKEDSSKAIARFVNQDLTEALNKAIEILEKWEKKMPRGKQWNEIMTALPNNLKDILTTIKEDGNAEIINNAMKMNSVVKEDAEDK